MGFWSRFLGRSAPQPYTQGDDTGYSGLLSLYGVSNAERVSAGFERFASLAYAGNASVFACISRRMALFSEATFAFRQLSDKHLFGNQALGKLERPWANASTGDLLSRMLLDADLAGNAYLRDGGDHLERLRPDWVTIVSKVVLDDMGRETRVVIGYAFDPIGDTDRHSEYFTVDEITHWAPNPDPVASFRGLSWITPVLREINSDMRMTEFRDAYFANAAMPNILVKYPNKVGPEKLKNLREMIDARHTGSLNAFSTLILDEGADPIMAGANMEGSAFDALQAAGETRIAAASGVPAMVAGFREGLQASKPGEYAQSMRAFADLTLRPLWRSACASLEKMVEVPAGAQLWFDVSDISALRQGEKDFADTQAQQAVTINTLIMAGYTADSVINAVVSGDLTLLVHSGLTSVQMQKPNDGTTPTPPPDPMTPPEGG